MNNDFKLPDPKEKDSVDNPEKLLLKLSEKINTTYEGSIFSTVISSGDYYENQERTFRFTLILMFLKHDDYSYPLIRVDCKNADGLFPVKVSSHYSPPIDYGEANNANQFKNVLDEILAEERTRNVILAMY